MNSVLILFLAIGPSNTQRVDRHRLVTAFAEIESSNQAQAWGDNHKSWGLYQFSVGRWKDVTGSRVGWAKCGPIMQTSVMYKALRLYSRRMPEGLSVEQQVIYLGRCHNGGPRITRHNSYTRKLWKAYR